MSALLSLLTTMSATPTTRVLRGVGMTHWRVGSINQFSLAARRDGDRLERTLEIAGHGTFLIQRQGWNPATCSLRLVRPITSLAGKVSAANRRA